METPMKRASFTILFAMGLTAAAYAEEHLAVVGDLELHVEAVPTTALTPEAARNYRVEPAADRGLLVVTLVKNAKGHAAAVPGQVYAGALTQSNFLINIPVREVREGKAVYYLGEFRLTPPDTLRFLVNANVAGQPLKAEFSRSFP